MSPDPEETTAPPAAEAPPADEPPPPPPEPIEGRVVFRLGDRRVRPEASVEIIMADGTTETVPLAPSGEFRSPPVRGEGSLLVDLGDGIDRLPETTDPDALLPGEPIAVEAGGSYEVGVDLRLDLEIAECPAVFSLADRPDGSAPSLEIAYRLHDPEGIVRRAFWEVRTPSDDLVHRADLEPEEEGTLTWNGRMTEGPIRGRHVFRAPGPHQIRIVCTPSLDPSDGVSDEAEVEVRPALARGLFMPDEVWPANPHRPKKARFRALARTRGIPDGDRLGLRLRPVDANGRPVEGVEPPEPDELAGVEVSGDRVATAPFELGWHPGIHRADAYAIEAEGLEGSSASEDGGRLRLARPALVIGNPAATREQLSERTAEAVAETFEAAGHPVISFRPSARPEDEDDPVPPRHLLDHQEAAWALFLDGRGTPDGVFLYTLDRNGRRIAHRLLAEDLEEWSHTPTALVWVNAGRTARGRAWTLRDTAWTVTFEGPVPARAGSDLARDFFARWLRLHDGDPAAVPDVLEALRPSYPELEPLLGRGGVDR